MDNANHDENLRKNLWQHQQHGTGDNNQQFYANQYQVRIENSYGDTVEIFFCINFSPCNMLALIFNGS